MTQDQTRPSAALLSKISAELQPVTASPLPSRLTLRIAPLALLMALAILFSIGLRRDALTLGPVVTWGASLVLVALGLLLVWIAARESTPAHRLPAPWVSSVFAVTWLILIAIAGWTFAASPKVMWSDVALSRAGLVCAAGGTIAGAVLVAIFAWSFRDALGAYPSLTGALYGTGAGITVNAGWRLVCPISTPWHFLAAHGPAVAATTLLGAIAARLIAKRSRNFE